MHQRAVRVDLATQARNNVMPSKRPSARMSYAARHQAILDGLMQLLEHTPSHRLTTAIIAKAVQVNEATLYRHFSSKHTLLWACCQHTHAQIMQVLAALPTQSDLAQQRYHMLACLLAYLFQHQGVMRLLLIDSLSIDDPKLMQCSPFFGNICIDFCFNRHNKKRHPKAPFLHLMTQRHTS